MAEHPEEVMLKGEGFTAGSNAAIEAALGDAGFSIRHRLPATRVVLAPGFPSNAVETGWVQKTKSRGVAVVGEEWLAEALGAETMARLTAAATEGSAAEGGGGGGGAGSDSGGARQLSKRRRMPKRDEGFDYGELTAEGEDDGSGDDGTRKRKGRPKFKPAGAMMGYAPRPQHPPMAAPKPAGGGGGAAAGLSSQFAALVAANPAIAFALLQAQAQAQAQAAIAASAGGAGGLPGLPVQLLSALQAQGAVGLPQPAAPPAAIAGEGVAAGGGGGGEGAAGEPGAAAGGGEGEAAPAEAGADAGGAHS